MLDLLAKIRDNYENFTPSARKIADYLAAHLLQAQYLSISDLARECKVAEATIFRFCKSLGFDGYNEFKLALAKSSLIYQSTPFAAYGQIDPKDDSLESRCRCLYTANVEALNQTLSLMEPEALTKATDYLFGAGKILGLGYGGSMATVHEAWSKFITITPKFFVLEDHHMQIMAASLLSADDVVLFISYSGSTREGIDVLRLAKERGAKVVLITHDPRSAATQYSDVVLRCGGDEAPLQAGSVAAKMAMLFVVDMLTNEYCRRNMEAAMQNKDTIANALAPHHF